MITGIGGRRVWSQADKGRIVAESFAAGANVSAVARRYGLRPQQVMPGGGWPAAARWPCQPMSAEEHDFVILPVSADLTWVAIPPVESIAICRRQHLYSKEWLRQAGRSRSASPGRRVSGR